MAFVTDSCGQALLFLSGVCCPSIIPTGVKHAGYDGFRPANAIFLKKKKKGHGNFPRTAEVLSHEMLRKRNGRDSPSRACGTTLTARSHHLHAPYENWANSICPITSRLN